MKKVFVIDVDCANCANKMEAAAAGTPGVQEASVNFFGQKLTVEIAPGEDEAAILAALKKRCKKFGDIEM